MKAAMFAILFLAAMAPAHASFLDKDALKDIDPKTLPEVVVHLDGKDQHYRAFGDMLIPSEEAEQKAFSGTIWPGGRVIFAFDPSIPDDSQQLFWRACGLWEQGTPIHCVQKTTERDYILVQGLDPSSGLAGQSVVGFHRGVQTLELAQWGQKTLVHEIGHAIGKAHEHQRSDAPNYLDIHLENTDPGSGARGNLVATHTRNYEPMDFASVMFYWTTAFSSNGQPTIVLKDQYKQFQDTIGELDHPSAADLQDVADAYRGVH